MQTVRAQDIWSGARRRYGTFLHSPLLDELKSLESMLAREAARRARADPGAPVERPEDPSVSVRLSGDQFGGPERLSLPTLPSMSSNVTIAQHFENEASPAAGSPKGAIDFPETPACRARPCSFGTSVAMVPCCGCALRRPRTMAAPKVCMRG